MFKKFSTDLKKEFCGYNISKFGKDCMAGLTVVAVALPLALAFGVSSGADAAAGLITAIIAGIIIGFFSGASYQISGPTGAMSAILITIVARYQLQGVFIATLLAGIILLICGLFKLGKLVGFIPAPVITGFTSGIAIIIALGQIDNFFGTHSIGDTAIQKIISYFSIGFVPNWQTLLIGALVVLIMVLYPKKWNNVVPSSLISIIIAGLVSNFAGFEIATVGSIPKSLLSDNRLIFSDFNFNMIKNLISPAFTIAALGMIESLLCGASASRMKNEAFDADRELVSQGIGNILLPFFGGVPATAAIARTNVAIKSGGVTRLTSIIHSLGLLASMFFLGGIMAKLPLAALAGVLMVTAWRMNEWKSIKYFFSKKFKSAITQFLVTMLATVIFDLTWAIIIGILISFILFVVNSSNLQVSISPVQNRKLKEKIKNFDAEKMNADTLVAYVNGPIFFTTVDKFKKALTNIKNCSKVIFSLRGCTTVDLCGIQTMKEMTTYLEKEGITVVFCGIQPMIKDYMNRSGLFDTLKESQIFSSVDQALLCERTDNINSEITSFSE